MKAGVNMSTDEKTAIPVTFEMPGSSEAKAAKWYQKRMVHLAAVISVVSLLVVIAVISGFVAMAKQHEKTNRRIIESSIPMPSGDDMKDKREIIADENIEIDTLTNTEGEDQVIVFDYNRRIMIKLEDDQCIVSALMENDNDEEQQSPQMLVVDTKPVHDDSFLSQTTRGMCNGKYIHWAHPGCLPEMEEEEEEEGDESDRAKRGVEALYNSYGGQVLRAGGQGSDGGSRCRSGSRTCCAWCYEGRIVNNRWANRITRGISSRGAYEIRPGSIILRRGSTTYVACVWFLVNRYNRPVYGCGIRGIQNP